MIKSFRSRETEKIWNGVRSKRLPQSIQQIARRKLRMLNNARSLNDLRVPPANRLEALRETGMDSAVFGSTINGESVSFGWTAMPLTLKSWTTIDGGGQSEQIGKHSSR